MPLDLSKLSPKEHILIKGAKLHNLKNIDIAIPRHKLVVITNEGLKIKVWSAKANTSKFNFSVFFRLNKGL